MSSEEISDVKGIRAEKKYTYARVSFISIVLTNECTQSNVNETVKRSKEEMPIWSLEDATTASFLDLSLPIETQAQVYE